MTSVNVNAAAVLSIAQEQHDLLAAEQQREIDLIADATIAYASTAKHRFSWHRREPLKTREEALHVLETTYMYNDDLLAKLNSAKSLHAGVLRELQRLIAAARLTLAYGDGMMSVSLEHASLLSKHSAKDVR